MHTTNFSALLALELLENVRFILLSFFATQACKTTWLTHNRLCILNLEEVGNHRHSLWHFSQRCCSLLVLA